MNTSINKLEAERLIEAFLRGSISSEERVQLQNWLSREPSNKIYFRQMYMIWKGSALYDKNKNSINTQRAFEKTWLRIMSSESDSQRQPGTSRSIVPGIWKYAAAIIISLIAGAIMYNILFDGQSRMKDLARNEITVPLGSRSHIVLPDGSEVWLNAGSCLSYDFNYGASMREVNLTGEGYFTVAKNTSRPFVVRTTGVDIKALGTEFNVKAYPDEKIISTILVKGSVEVRRTNINGKPGKESAADKLVLVPGQKLMVNKEPDEPNLPHDQNRISPDDGKPNQSGFQLEMTNPSIETSWKENKWTISGEYLDDLCVLLSRRYNISVKISDPLLAQYKFSGTLQQETLEQVFEILSLTVPISYSIEKGNATLEINRKLESKYKGAYKTNFN